MADSTYTTGTGRLIPFLLSLFPFLRWLPLVNARSLKADCAAGLTGAVIVLPQGVAFATIAGLPPEYGLYAAIVPTIVAALFGSSMHLISGPTTAISIVIFANVSTLAEPLTPEYVRLALTLTLMAGVVQLGLGLAKLGGLINFVSHPVVVGFTAGAALLIGTSQLGSFFGLTVPRGRSFLTTLGGVTTSIGQTNPYALAVAATTLAAAILLRVLRPRWPALLLAMILGSLLGLALGGSDSGIRLVGSLPDRLPPLSIPDLSLSSLRRILPGSLAVAMLGLAEAVAIARSVAARSRQRIDNSQEFIGQGLSNVIGSFFSAYASSGSFTRTGVNYQSGARTPLAAVFAAVALSGILLLVAPLTAYLPIPSMAGILLLVAWSLIDIRQIKAIVRTSRQETWVFLVTFLGTLFLDLEFAIFSGVLLALLLYLNRTSHPHFTVLAPNASDPRRPFVNVAAIPVPECPQLKILRLDGSIFFGAVNHIAEELHRIVEDNPEQWSILIVGSGINFIDVAGCEMLFHEGHSFHLGGRRISLCSLKREVMDVLRRGNCVKSIGQGSIYGCKEEALAQIVPTLDPERCRDCRRRIFLECASQPAPEGWLDAGRAMAPPVACPL